MKEYTIKHETTHEVVTIKAQTIDSETHKYQWTFWGVNETGEIAIYSQRWNIVDIKYLDK